MMTKMTDEPLTLVIRNPLSLSLLQVVQAYPGGVGGAPPPGHQPPLVQQAAAAAVPGQPQQQVWLISK